MSDGLACGDCLPEAKFEELAHRAVVDAFKWNMGRSTLCSFPLILGRALFERLSSCAVALDAEARATEVELLGRRDLHGLLGLPWPLRLALLRATEVRGCRYARFDFHPVEGGGFAITEGNVDVAAGFNEGGGVTALFAPHVPGAEAAGDPAAAVARALVSTVGRGAVVGCMYMTNFVDDHQVVKFVARRFEEAGLVPVLFGPSQLRWMGSHAAVRRSAQTVRLDAVFRFFPADWLPRLAVSSRWWRMFQRGSTVWANPPSTILSQSKRAPLAWSRLRTPLPTWRRWLPETRRPEDVDGGEWVVKPALAHEGYRIAMRGVTERSTYAEILRDAKSRPWRWAAQRRFRAATLDTPDGPRFPCVGVYVVEGEVAGLYGRLSARPLIDDTAQDVVVLVRRDR